MTKLEQSKQKKGLVFCWTCRRIIGDSFPVNHGHIGLFDNHGHGVSALERGDLGFGFFKDSKENRKDLAKRFPPRDKITIPLTTKNDIMGEK